jgi:hypothetical protein
LKFLIRFGETQDQKVSETQPHYTTGSTVFGFMQLAFSYLFIKGLRNIKQGQKDTLEHKREIG